MPTVDIDAVWQRIQALAGQEFRMIRGQNFTYEVTADHVSPDRTNQRSPKSHFEKALALAPLGDTTAIQDLRGPSFIYAILMDSRVRQSDW